MLDFPPSTAFGRRLPKELFYKNLDVKPELKRCFIDQIRRITWANKLSPETLNIAAGQTVQEIEVFHIQLTGQELDDRVLPLMDKGIPYHLLFILERTDGQCRLSIAYKEATEKSSAAFQLKECYHTAWMAQDALSLELTALNMDALYESLVRQIAGEALQAGKKHGDLKEDVEWTQEKARIERQITKLQTQMRREKQLARQMEIRREIARLKRLLENHFL